MSFDWKKFEFSEKFVIWVSNIATVGGIFLGFYTLAATIRAGLPVLGAIVGLIVGVASALSLLAKTLPYLGPPSKARLAVLGFIIVLISLAGTMFGLFAFMNSPII
ncbi:hypothetical protein [Rhizobium leguminosarum]|uniref:hypothetical protein n=1 Tax=Rhizobium leguminosarum TaxID=384 RepID=UPI001C953F24|nr:hypothetical protein [Rhizobium leguminosarum]MBY5827669.1 hypothetical protein [Rhizobium leguminosarum]